MNLTSFLVIIFTTRPFPNKNTRNLSDPAYIDTIYDFPMFCSVQGIGFCYILHTYFVQYCTSCYEMFLAFLSISEEQYFVSEFFLRWMTTSVSKTNAESAILSTASTNNYSQKRHRTEILNSRYGFPSKLQRDSVSVLLKARTSGRIRAFIKGHFIKRLRLPYVTSEFELITFLWVSYHCSVIWNQFIPKGWMWYFVGEWRK